MLQATVGAGSVVTKNVEPYTVVAGNPAKFLRYAEKPNQIDQIKNQVNFLMFTMLYELDYLFKNRTIHVYAQESIIGVHLFDNICIHKGVSSSTTSVIFETNYC